MAKDTGKSTVMEPIALSDTLGSFESISAIRPCLALAWTEPGRRKPAFAEIPDRGLLLGRGRTSFGAPLLDERMSRSHLEIRKVSRQPVWMAADCGSRNGSRVNGRRILEPHSLQPGDVLRLGNSLLVYIHSPSEETEPNPLASSLVGSSEAMRKVRRTIAAVAAHQTSVLIAGETGTGKEVAAQALHDLSGRKGPFVAINCGAVSGGVLESELFGHARGAFTGAVGSRHGLFREADGGTLFLDELGEMPGDLQVKLLRVIETREVRPVGSSQAVKVDVRLLAATNRDLVAEVRAGRFRQDLFARLYQWPVAIPPLRERRQDIPELVVHLLDRLDSGPHEPSADLLEALMLHSWPLNVRGLLNVLSVATITARPGEPLHASEEVLQMLRTERELGRPATLAPEPRDEGLASGDEGVRGRKAGAMRSAAPPPTPSVLEEALQRHAGSVASAARELGCSRQQIYRVLQQEGWTLDRFRQGG